MPIHDYFIDNGTGANVRADINAALSAIVSLNSNPTEPGTMYAYQLWADTTSNLLKIRNSGNSAWITLRQLDGDFSIVAVEDGLQATPSLTFTNDLNTGVFRAGADALAIVTGGQYAIACTSTQAVGIRTPNPSTALHVAGNARVGADDVTDAHLQIGKGATGNRNSYIDIVADTTYTDYGLRVIRNNTGANATSELKHRGTGALNFTTQEAASIVFNTTNSPRLTIDPSGTILVNTAIQATNNGGLNIENTGAGTSTTPLALLNRGTTNNTGVNLSFRGLSAASAETDYAYLRMLATDTTSRHGRIEFWTGNSGTVTQKLGITHDGDVSIVTGNLIIGTAGKGIDFSATANSSGTMTSELLDDYEEGVFTPTIEGSTSAGTGTYSNRIGTYTKIGDTVFFRVYIIWSGHTGTGDLQLSGLPFTSNSTSGYFSAVNVGSVSDVALTANNVFPGGYVTTNSSRVVFAQMPVGGGTATAVPFDSAGNLIFSGHYIV